MSVKENTPTALPLGKYPSADWTGNGFGPGVGLDTAPKTILCPAITEPRTSFQPVRSLVTPAVNLSDSQRFDRILTLIATFFSTLGYFLWDVSNFKFTDFI